ncbi:MAG TPA: DUF5134 domain-containing protein [Pseudonocardiaceae bacterium]|nr:DUF5134 domain-containing protein [Pseudonocardiaceae bacterium]
MGEPESVRWVITAMFAAVTLTCLLRLASGRRNRPEGFPRRHDDLGHLVMSVSMIAMVLSWTHLLPTVFWVLLFAAQAVFFGATLLRRSSDWSGHESWDHTHHLMASLGMVYMVVALGDAAAMAGMSMSLPPLAGAFGVYFLLYALWSGARAVRLAPGPAGCSGSPSVLGRPLAVHGCRALMGAGMAYVLFTV